MKDFLSEKIRDVYKKAHSIKSEFNCDDFYISFKFMPYTNILNFDSIQSDGFTLEYNSDEEKKETSIDSNRLFFNRQLYRSE